MEFSLPKFREPNFSLPIFINSPDVVCSPAPSNGAAPDFYHATTMFPEYFRVNGKWTLAEESRMDGVAVVGSDNKISVKEFRNLKEGDMVVIGRTENCEDGIFVYTNGFGAEEKADESFAFRTGRSRETAYSKDYDYLYELLEYEKYHGSIVWVLGPACSFDADARAAMSDLISRGYAHALLAGNALATHDLEGGLLKTALGQDIYTQRVQQNGHYNHIDTINKVRRCGSIPKFVEEYEIKDGIMYSCVKNDVPFVLTGSIRDDGPLPEVIADVYAGQDAMRKHVSRATTVICLATQLHSIATGNMTPSYRVVDGEVRPTFFYSIDISEFAVNKLKDRGSLSVTTIIANAQDFLVNLQRGTVMSSENK